MVPLFRYGVSALAGTGFRLAGCGSPISVWLWGSEKRVPRKSQLWRVLDSVWLVVVPLLRFSLGFVMVRLFRFFWTAKRNGGGLQVLFLQFALPTIVLITHNRCTHKSSDHPQTDSQNITNTPPSIPFGHPTLSKTTNIHDPHTKTLTLRNFRPNGTPYPQEQDITKTNLYVIHTKTLTPYNFWPNGTSYPQEQDITINRATLLISVHNFLTPHC